MMSNKTFKYLYIPVDNTKPIEERICTYNDDNIINIFIDHIKPHFNNTSDENKLSIQDIRNNLKSSASQQNIDIDKIDDKILQQLYSTTTVDAIPLYNATIATSYTTISIYCDDKGQIKSLPINQRATLLCKQIGNNIDVLGDIFIARYYDNQDKFYRLDFTLDEFNNTNKYIWFELAKLCKQHSNNSIVIENELRKKFTNDKLLQQCSIGILGCTNNATSRCARCKNIAYCSALHQKLDWPRHKQASCVTTQFNTQSLTNSRQNNVSHGHSHNGVACSGHGGHDSIGHNHSHDRPTGHTHSHGGKPCTGH